MGKIINFKKSCDKYTILYGNMGMKKDPTIISFNKAKLDMIKNKKISKLLNIMNPIIGLFTLVANISIVYLTLTWLISLGADSNLNINPPVYTVLYILSFTYIGIVSIFGNKLASLQAKYRDIISTKDSHIIHLDDNS